MGHFQYQGDAATVHDNFVRSVLLSWMHYWKGGYMQDEKVDPDEADKKGSQSVPDEATGGGGGAGADPAVDAGTGTPGEGGGASQGGGSQGTGGGASQGGGTGNA